MSQSDKQRLRFAAAAHGRTLAKKGPKASKKPSLKDALMARKGGRGY